MPNLMEFPLYMGGAQNFDLVFRTYHQPLRFFAAKFVSDDEAEDMVENLFLKLFEKNQQFSSEVHMQSFLYKSIHNACLNHFKSAKVKAIYSDAASEGSVQEREIYLSQMIRAEVLGEIYREIKKLPPQCSKVISLSYIDGMSNAEIADKMNLSEQSVKNYKVRGLKILKDNLSDDALLILIILANLG